MRDFVPAFGWFHDPAEVEKVLATLPIPVFGTDEYAAIKDTGVGQDVFFWEFEEKVLGKVLPSWNQGQAGTCVSFGWGRAVQDLMLAQICLRVVEEWPGQEVATEPIYGGSRVEVGKRRAGRGDGSIGAWAAKWVTDWGILLRKTYGQYDLSRYSESLSRDWGYNGVPDDLEPTAKLNPVKTVTLVRMVEQLRDLICNLYPCAICGNLGRSMKRQPGGWCRVEGSWAHCQEICGHCVVKGGKTAFVYRNSWGSYLGADNARVQLESGREIELPDGCYLSEYDPVAKELRLEDTFTLADAVGYRRRNVDWRNA